MAIAGATEKSALAGSFLGAGDALFPEARKIKEPSMQVCRLFSNADVVPIVPSAAKLMAPQPAMRKLVTTA